jgi:hypothetical protein
MQQTKAKQIRWLFVGSLVAFGILWGGDADDSIIGVSQKWANGSYLIESGTSPWAITYSFVTVGFYVLLMSARPCECGQNLPGVFRRLVAFSLDFVIGGTVITPILALLPTLLEWRHTGWFKWHFVRATPAFGDDLATDIGLLLALIALLLYYTLPLTFGKPSPGSCIVGYQIVPDEGQRLEFSKAMTRTLYGFTAVLFACFAPFVARDREKGKFWLDRLFRTHAVILN